MAGGNKTAKLYGRWMEAKVSMVGWLIRTLESLPVGEKASDVKAMTDAITVLGKIVGNVEERIDLGNSAGTGEEARELGLGELVEKVNNMDFSKIFSTGGEEEDEDGEEAEEDKEEEEEKA